jgi:septation ring formation regulator EzrA
MVDQSMPDPDLPDFPHHVLDRLTAMKLLVGSLRGHLTHEPCSLEKIEACLDQIEREIDATATLAQDVQAKGGSST